MNRKLFGVIIPVLVVIEICSIFVMYKSFNNDLLVGEDKTESVAQKKQFSMFVENSNGKYVEYTGSNYFPDGYTLNTDKTLCTDNRGIEVYDVLTINNNFITVNSGKTIYCYLYFDLS